jgi:hypothetical protein
MYLTRNAMWIWELDGTSSGSCTIVSFSTHGVQTLGPTAEEFSYFYI